MLSTHGALLSVLSLMWSRMIFDVLRHLLLVRPGQYIVVGLWFPQRMYEPGLSLEKIPGQPNMNIQVSQTWISLKGHLNRNAQAVLSNQPQPYQAINKRVWRQALHCVLGCPIIRKDICELIGLTPETAGILKVAFLPAIATVNISTSVRSPAVFWI